MIESRITSYAGLFRGPHSVRGIEIPLIQRDYAQGREGRDVERIRCEFLRVLHGAVSDPKLAVSLDFVYGIVTEGVLRPLDGQQRLTTLFLLHWYVASCAGRLEAEQGRLWTNFRYATRPSAGSFCDQLTRHRLPEETAREAVGDDKKPVSDWIIDQPWYLYTWAHDPTIQAMLTMLDAIHRQFQTAEWDGDYDAAWKRLTCSERPAVSFHFLPLENGEDGSELYIKMNSRGRPLTPFENFKARFQQVIDEGGCDRDRAERIALKLDTDWSDVFWTYRGDDQVIDDEMLRYIDWVTMICCWRNNRSIAKKTEDLREIELAAAIYGPGHEKGAENLDFFEKAMDAWVKKDDIGREGDIGRWFGGLFRVATGTAEGDGKVVLFGKAAADLDLLKACCDTYERASPFSRFSRADTLLLYAAVLHRSGKTKDFHRRLRVLRNLLANTDLRVEDMPALVEDVEKLVCGPDLDEALHSLERVGKSQAFNQNRVADERSKLRLLERYPEVENELFRLEDHPLLRGCLFAFDLDVDAAVFARRAQVFHQVFLREHWSALTGALLTFGDYWRHIGWGKFLFGTASGNTAEPWQTLLTSSSRENTENTRESLLQLLDFVSVTNGDVVSILEKVIDDWVKKQKTFCWRYYLVKYDAMRKGNSGRYLGDKDKLGYRICMMDKKARHSRYRDAFLYAIYEQIYDKERAIDENSLRFTGNETSRRLMKFKTGGISIECVPEGFKVTGPNNVVHAEIFNAVAAKYNFVKDHEDYHLHIPKTPDASGFDAADRIVIGVAFLNDLVEAGFAGDLHVDRGHAHIDGKTWVKSGASDPGRNGIARTG